MICAAVAAVMSKKRCPGSVVRLPKASLPSAAVQPPRSHCPARGHGPQSTVCKASAIAAVVGPGDMRPHIQLGGALRQRRAHWSGE